MFCLYNASHKLGAIQSKEAMIRILAYGTQEEVMRIAKTDFPDIETRMWPVSTISNISWRTLLNKNLSLLADPRIIQADYDDIPVRVNKWNAFREKAAQEVSDAAQNRIMRPVDQVKGENLLAQYREGHNPEEELAVQGLLKLKTATFELPVEPVGRAQEQRGQGYSIIAIIGDSDADRAKEVILETLTKDYDAYESVRQSSKFNFEPYARQMQSVVEEPIIAFFGFGDQPELLEKQAKELAKLPALKHADIGVVMNYSWIQPSFVGKTKQKTYSENPIAQNFFEKMAQATVKASA